MGKLPSRVVVMKSTYDDVYHNLSRAIELVGPLPLTSAKMVVIKLNLCDARTPETGTITHPLFLDALLRYLRNNFENLDIYVVH